MIYSGQILSHCGIKIKQVNKTKAKKAYDDGEVVWLHNPILRIDNIYQLGMDPIKNRGDKSFEYCIYEFLYYNNLYYNNLENSKSRVIYFIEVKDEK